MSSILDALKKAERESRTQGAAKLPLPAPRAARRHRWWIVVGMVVVLGSGAAMLWHLYRPVAAPLRAGTASVPSSTVAGKIAPQPVKPKIPTQPKPPAPPAGETAPPMPPPQRTVSPQPVVPRTVARPGTPPPLPAGKTVEGGAATAAVKPPAAEPPAASPVPSTPPAQPRASVANKEFRNDPRIHLQALVWAPEAAERLVVINDRLIKEGGTVEGITVVRIDRDDVLLSEGADRWYQAFRIR